MSDLVKEYESLCGKRMAYSSQGSRHNNVELFSLLDIPNQRKVISLLRGENEGRVLVKGVNPNWERYFSHSIIACILGPGFSAAVEDKFEAMRNPEIFSMYVTRE